MKYIVTYETKRKNAKRHTLNTCGKRDYFKSVAEAEKAAANLNRDFYKVAIYTAKFELVKEI